MAIGTFSILDPIIIYLHLLTPKQDIAPTYYDVNSFPKGDIRSSLQRAADRLARKEKMRSERR